MMDRCPVCRGLVTVKDDVVETHKDGTWNCRGSNINLVVEGARWDYLDALHFLEIWERHEDWGDILVRGDMEGLRDRLLAKYEQTSKERGRV